MHERDGSRSSAFQPLSRHVALRTLWIFIVALLPVLVTGQGGDLAAAKELAAQVGQLEAAGRYAEAIPLAEKALAIFVTVLGTDHPDTTAARGVLALLLLSSADPVTTEVVAKVEALFGQNDAILQRSRGPAAWRGLLTGRAFLLPDQKGPLDYGLHSLLLFDAPPKDAAERALHLKTLEAYLLVLPPMTELERHRLRSQLNITLVPVTREITLPSDLMAPGQAARTAEQVLAAYDYSRAKVLLDDLGRETRRSGPYLVSTDETLRQRLFIDMSHVVPDLAWEWTRTFCWLAAQERSWSDQALKKLELNMRNAFELAATRLAVTLNLSQSIRLLDAPGR